MCEIAIFMRANNGHPTDPVLNALRFDVGHVVEIQEDGAYWGPGDLAICKVVKYPGIPAANMAYLLTPVPAQADKLAQLRAVKIAAPELLSDTIDPKAVPEAQFQATMTVAVPDKVNPLVIGSSPNVLG